MPQITSENSRKHSTTLIAYVIGLSALIGCGGAPKTEKVAGPAQLETVNELEQPFDMNGDGKPDVWRNYVQKGKDKVLVSKSFDLNFDQKVDFKRFYSEEGKVLKDQMDMDFDGSWDRSTYYKNNRIERKEVSLQGDEAPEVFKYYNKQGQLYYLEGDRDGDTVLDYWEYYREGKLVRIGHDLNGDGKLDSNDKWEELD